MHRHALSAQPKSIFSRLDGLLIQSLRFSLSRKPAGLRLSNVSSSPSLKLVQTQAEAKSRPASERLLATDGDDASESSSLAEGSRRSEPSPASEPADDAAETPMPLSSDRQEDARWVCLARGGDIAAFERLYRKYSTFAFHLAVRLQGGRTDAEDLVHDAFLKAHERMATLREPSAFRGWLGSILVSLLRTRMRRQRLLRTVGLASQEPVELDGVASPDAGPEVRAELAQLYALLRLVPIDERIAWTLRHVEKHRLEEVAGLCACSLATVKRRISKAQHFLNEHYVASEFESGT